MFPAPRLLQYANNAIVQDRYNGTIQESDFSYQNIIDRLSPTSTKIAKQSTFKCYSFNYKGKNAIVPSQPIAYASFKEVYEKGMVYGTGGTGPDIFDASSGVSLTAQNSTITIKGVQYYIKLMTGIPGDTLASTVNDSPNFDPSPEYELFLYSIWSGVSGVTPYYDVPQADKVTKINVGGSTRRWVLCQGSDGSRTSPRSVGRGRFDTQGTSGYVLVQVCTSSLSPLWTVAQDLWWPIFIQV